MGVEQVAAGSQPGNVNSRIPCLLARLPHTHALTHTKVFMIFLYKCVSEAAAAAAALICQHGL